MDRVIKCGCCTNDDYYCENCKSPALDARECIAPALDKLVHQLVDELFSAAQGLHENYCFQHDSVEECLKQKHIAPATALAAAAEFGYSPTGGTHG